MYWQYIERVIPALLILNCHAFSTSLDFLHESQTPSDFSQGLLKQSVRKYTEARLLSISSHIHAGGLFYD